MSTPSPQGQQAVVPRPASGPAGPVRIIRHGRHPPIPHETYAQVAPRPFHFMKGNLVRSKRWARPRWPGGGVVDLGSALLVKSNRRRVAGSIDRPPSAWKPLDGRQPTPPDLAHALRRRLLGALSYAIWVWATTEPEDPRARRVRAVPGDALPPTRRRPQGRRPRAALARRRRRRRLVGRGPFPPRIRRLEAGRAARRIGRSCSTTSSGTGSTGRPCRPGPRRAVRLPGQARRGGRLRGRGARPRSPPGTPQRVVVFGDSSKNSVGQKKVAYQTHCSNPTWC